jgi:hypothetical protein
MHFLYVCGWAQIIALLELAAERKVWREINEGNRWILDADLRSYFDSISQDRLISLIAKESSDGQVLRLIRSFLEAGAIANSAWEPTVASKAETLALPDSETPITTAITGLVWVCARAADHTC